MKIVAPAAHLLESQPTAPAFVSDLMVYLRENDPTAIFRLLSLLYNESIETLVETIGIDDGMEVFQMLSFGFTLNLVADLIEASRALGFYKEDENA